jgi:hypothetical protein
MLTAKGCIFGFIGDSDDAAYERLRATWAKPGERCPDCGAIAGELHHFGCDVERCPKCGGQLIGCECFKSPYVYTHRPKKEVKEQTKKTQPDLFSQEK